ncbi:ROK family protein [Clostridium lacusfryxellense]|uniref:ROK family protein n=1 Tax=Clostridium lacusfryxellense TaxID=205328 RepID=UPI001C0E581B|nr:ROK family protein [Clostridium lacusfryxellense]MBU3114746.1 ROK family protein [Clostridium lacusfryxellense]
MAKIVRNTMQIRSYNTKKIIDYLRFSIPATKKEISDNQGLSFATVSNLCNELIKDGILGINSSLNSNGGRIPGLISIMPLVKLTLAINLSQDTEVDLALINLKNEVIAEKRISVFGLLTAESIIDELYKHSDNMIEEHNIDWSYLLGLGVAVPGIFFKDNKTIINSTNGLYEDKPLKDMFERVFGLPTYIENESNLLVTAASLYDPKEFKTKNLIYIFTGEGLGTGIITQGNLVTGNSGLGGEINHMPIGEKGFKCYCGSIGCIETELSKKGFLKKYYGTEFLSKNYDFDTWENFIFQVEAGQKKAIEVIVENGKLFGKLISILVNIFDPKIVYMGGITERIFGYLYPSMIEEVQSRCSLDKFHNFSVCNSKSYKNLIYQGCSELTIKQWVP